MAWTLLWCVFLVSTAAQIVSRRDKASPATTTLVLGDAISWPAKTSLQKFDYNAAGLTEDSCQTKVNVFQREVKAIKPTEFSFCFGLITCSCVHYFYSDGSYAVHHALSSVLNGDPFSEDFTNAFTSRDMKAPGGSYEDVIIAIQVAGDEFSVELLISPLVKLGIPRDHLYVFFGGKTLSSGTGVGAGSVGEAYCQREKILEAHRALKPEVVAEAEVIEVPKKKKKKRFFGLFESDEDSGSLSSMIDTLSDDISRIDK